MDLAGALALHDQAATRLLRAAAAVAPGRWADPRAEGKWSPAEIVEHLVVAYDVVLGELSGGPPMQVRTGRWQRFLLRWTVLPKILSGRGFPHGAPAPRETRPKGLGLDRDDLLAAFAERADGFARAAGAAGPERRLTHAYFGAAPVATGVQLCARHVEHHAAQLERLAG